MCELRQPAPGLIFDLLHPHFNWGLDALLMLFWVIQFVVISTATGSKGVTMSAARARRLALVAGVCFLVAAVYPAFMGLPSDGSRRAWLTPEGATVPQDCLAFIRYPASNAAFAVRSALFVLFVMLPLAAGAILLSIARRGRGNYRMWWIRGMW